ncbi:hypothetical protein ACFPTX_02045 [Pseudomonas sp. GCM10022188]|uniref:hypothetical protein n=1 Tax=Pseudomonas TaxID=286 RepID=UPI001E386C84|nr:hypothetical protein [Pseudomonas oryzagri]MCC6076490.1 hypothetical protein [Pseudomonas oryzagri]
MIDYSIFYRRSISAGRIKKELAAFDVFISAYNSSDRVIRVFQDVVAGQKFWVLHPEYRYAPLDEPHGAPLIRPCDLDEVAQVNNIVNALGGSVALGGLSLCIDTTGFMRHVLVFLVAKLAHSGVQRVTFLYSEPVSYVQQEDTPFSTTTTGRVRPVRGMSLVNASNDKDHLILGVGYDHKLISEVVNNKDDAEVYPVFGFPSLGPDMYQQSALRASESGDVALSSKWVSNRNFAPANDPFATAEAIRDIVLRIDFKYGSPNIYLAPLSTKAQTLGFALYWQLEGRQRGGVSLLTPECTTYSRETSLGIKRLWAYEVEFF